MKRSEFIAELKARISGLAEDEVSERIDFYGEMIDDRIDAGLSEDEAVADIGDVDKIAAQILSGKDATDTALRVLDKSEKKKHSTKEIILIVSGSPLWLPLMIVAFAVVFSIYVAFLSIVIAFWAIPVSFAAGAVAGLILGPAFLFAGYAATGAVVFGSALILAALSIPTFFGCKVLTSRAVKLAKLIIQFGTKIFRKRREK